jgi:hypothetical protein
MIIRTETRIAQIKIGIPTGIEIPMLMETRTGIPILTAIRIAAMTMTDTVAADDADDAAEGEINKSFCRQFI